MGRLALFLAVATALTAGYSSISRLGILDRQYGVMESGLAESYARQAALSGLSIAEHRIRQALRSGTSPDYQRSDVPIEDGARGSYDVVVATNDTSITAHVIGYYGDQNHSASQALSASYGEIIDMPAALMVYTASASPEVKSGATLTGFVTRPPSIAALDWTSDGKRDIAGLGVSTAILAEYNDELGSAEWSRVTGAEKYVTSNPPYWMRGVIEEVESHPSTIIIDEMKLEDNDVLGSPTNPALVIITDDIFINDDAKGYGVLLVKNGHVWMNQRGSWEGLIIIEATGANTDIELDIEDTNSIYGAVLMYGVASSATRWTSSWEYGDAEVELWDESQIYWSPDVIGRLSQTLPSLQGGFVIRRTVLEP